MAFQAYQFGIKPQKMPEPYHFVWGSGAMALAAIVSQANERVGIALAWALLIGALTLSFTTAKKAAAT